MIASTRKPNSERPCSRQVWEIESIRSAKRSPAAEGDLAVDDGAAPPALGAVVGRLHPLDLGEGPKRRPELQQVAGEGAEVAVAGALLAVGLKQRPQSTLRRRDLTGEPLAIAVVGEGIPGTEQLATDLQALLAEAPLLGDAF